MEKSYSTNPRTIQTSELLRLKEQLLIDPERFAKDIQEINEELVNRPDYTNPNIGQTMQ